MKKPVKKKRHSEELPHIYRKFPAGLIYLGFYVFLWIAMVSLLSFNISTFIPDNKKQSLNIRVLQTRDSANSHLQLARLYWDNHRTEMARRELTIAADLISPAPAPHGINVLGATDTPFDLIKNWEAEQTGYRDDFNFWNEIVTARPDYKDAYRTLIGLASVLNKTVESAAYAQRIDQLENSPSSASAK